MDFLIAIIIIIAEFDHVIGNHIQSFIKDVDLCYFSYFIYRCVIPQNTITNNGNLLVMEYYNIQ